jgi:hypothetical protein
VLAVLRDLAAGADDELGIMGNLRIAPPLPVIPESLQGTPIVALIVTYAGAVDDGQRTLRDMLAALPEPAVNAVVPKQYTAHQKMFDPAVPHGRHYYWKSHKLPPLAPEIADIVIEHMARITSPLSSIPIFTQGGAVARVPESATAYAHRDAMHDINIVGSWMPDDAEPQRHVEWVCVRELHERRHRVAHSSGLQRRAMGATRRAQGEVRPIQRVQAQRQHPTERVGPAGQSRRAKLSSWPSGSRMWK